MSEEIQADYEWWQNALKGNFGPIHDGHPQPGFYRKRKHKGGPWQAVAIWSKGGEMVALVDEAEEIRADDIWTWCCQNPVAYEVYQKAVAGEGWPDDVPGLGHNRPDDGEAAIKDQIDGAIALAKEALQAGITDKETADRAANIRDRLNELWKAADATRKAEKKPHDDAGKAVQKKWKPVLDAAKAAADSLRGPIGRVLAELQRKANEAAIKSQKEAAEKAEREGEAASVPDPPAIVRVGGSSGRKTGLRTTVRGEITDYGKALQALADESEVRDTVQRIVSRRARAGVETPGVKIIKEKVAA